MQAQPRISQTRTSYQHSPVLFKRIVGQIGCVMKTVWITAVAIPATVVTCEKFLPTIPGAYEPPRREGAFD